jgi:mRNA interferase MazF
MTSFIRGDVVWVNLDPTIGSEIRKQRPCVILSLTALNNKRSTVVVAPLASSGHVRPPLVIAVDSVGKGSNARIDQLRAVDKSRIGNVFGKLPDHEMLEIERAIVTVLGL